MLYEVITRTAFPAGRWLSTLFENGNAQHIRINAASGEWETIDEHKTNITAVGHFKPYRTHRLYPQKVQERESVKPASTAESVRLFLQSSNSWMNDTKGSRMDFGEVVLERTANSAARNPYLVVYVDKNLIADHNDIDDESYNFV